jgi:hypothetical protein
MDLDDGLLAEAVVGRQAENFLNSDIGQALLAKAEMEARDAMDVLKKIAPDRQQEIRELQNRIWRADSFEGWLVELIQSGRQAATQLEQQRVEESDA